MNREKIACNCKNITYGMIEDAIANGASSYEEVEELLNLGQAVDSARNLFIS